MRTGDEIVEKKYSPVNSPVSNSSRFILVRVTCVVLDDRFICIVSYDDDNCQGEGY